MNKNKIPNYIAAFKLNVVKEAEKSKIIAAERNFALNDRQDLEWVKNKDRLPKMAQKLKASRGGGPLFLN